jgi:aminocarboxymuconate-semialdehyde decarboxylase
VDEYALFALVGYPVDTTMLIARLIFSGVLDRFPRIPWIFYHGGGTAPYLGGRWDQGRRKGPGTSGLARLPSEYLASLYFDTLLYHPGALGFLVRMVGTDRVLMGTDYPYMLMADEDPVGTVRDIPRLTAADCAKILGGNATRLFKLPANDAPTRHNPNR